MNVCAHMNHANFVLSLCKQHNGQLVPHQGSVLLVSVLSRLSSSPSLDAHTTNFPEGLSQAWLMTFSTCHLRLVSVWMALRVDTVSLHFLDSRLHSPVSCKHQTLDKVFLMIIWVYYIKLKWSVVFNAVMRNYLSMTQYWFLIPQHIPGLRQIYKLPSDVQYLPVSSPKNFNNLHCNYDYRVTRTILFIKRRELVSQFNAPKNTDNKIKPSSSEISEQIYLFCLIFFSLLRPDVKAYWYAFVLN